MPLVTKRANQLMTFKQATEPSGWQNGDFWVDTDNGFSYVNIGGTATQISTGAYTANDIFYATSVSALAELGIGANGQVLTVSGGAPAWGAAGSGALELIEQITAGGASGTMASSTLSLNLESGYAQVFVELGFQASGAANLDFRINGNSTANYEGVMISSDGSTVSTSQSSGATSLRIGTSVGSTLPTSVWLVLGRDPIGEKITMHSKLNLTDSYNAQVEGVLNVDVNSTITDIDFILSTGTFTSGSLMTIWGLKDA